MCIYVYISDTCVQICVHIHKYIYIYMHIHVYTRCVYICVFICYICIDLCTYTQIYIYIYIYICIYTYIHVYTRKNVHMCVSIIIYVYIRGEGGGISVRFLCFFGFLGIPRWFLVISHWAFCFFWYFQCVFGFCLFQYLLYFLVVIPLLKRRVKLPPAGFILFVFEIIQKKASRQAARGGLANYLFVSALAVVTADTSKL